MALSAVGLLREAERHAWQLVQSAQQVPAAAADDREQARQWHRERGDALMAGWSTLAPRAERLLTAVAGASPDDALGRELRELAAVEVAGEVDTHMRRIGDCIGAAADLLEGEAGRSGSPREVKALRDQCVRLIETVVTATQGHVQHAQLETPTMVDDLLSEAERHAWQLVQSPPQIRSAAAEVGLGPRHKAILANPDREKARQWHRERGDALMAGWSTLAPRAERLLSAVPGAPNDDALRQGLRGVAAVKVAGEADPQMRRISECIGAAADLLEGQEVRPAFAADGKALRDRCVRLIESVATTTRGHMEHMTIRRGFQGLPEIAALTDELRMERAEPGRKSVFEDVAAPRPGRLSLEGAMHEWGRVSGSGTDPHAAAASTDRLRAIVADMAIITRAAAEVVTQAEKVAPTRVGAQAREHCVAAAQAWTDVLVEWPRWLRSGQGIDAEQVSATMRLREELMPIVKGSEADPARSPAGSRGHATARRMLVDVETVSDRCAAAVRTLARSEAFIAPARRLVEEVARDATRDQDVTGVDPVPARYPVAAARGRWTNAAADAPSVQRLVTSVEAAAEATKVARQFGDATVHAALSSPSLAASRGPAAAARRARPARGVERGADGVER